MAGREDHGHAKLGQKVVAGMLASAGPNDAHTTEP